MQTSTYATSKLLCNFFFPGENLKLNKCKVRPRLQDGVIHHYKNSVSGEKIVVRLFPPIIDHYGSKHYYEISQLFIGGTCACSSGYPSPCITATEDNTFHNDGLREILICASDRWHYGYGYFFHAKKRRRREATCPCSRDGTMYGLCKPFIGLGYQCPCKHNFAGSLCDKCSKGHYGYPKCNVCACDYIGSKSSNCNLTTGQCSCEDKYSGLKCNRCAIGRYNFPFCYPCPCPTDRTKDSVCDANTGKCHCLNRYNGEKCTSCKRWLENWPICHRPGCKCSKEGAIDGTCTDGRQCRCKNGYTGKRCDQCMPGFGTFPNCTACQCNAIGSHDNNCNPKTGQCACKSYFTGKTCNQCTKPGLKYPRCYGNDKCKCSKAGTRFARKTNGPCIKRVSCICKRNVNSANCSECKVNHYNLSSAHPEGCKTCQCDSSGSFASLATCDRHAGQCVCKPTVVGRNCNRCKDGYHLMNRWNLFGCTACNCNIGGSVNPNCANNGECTCKGNFEGKTCNRLKDGPFYVPDFYHNLIEVESATSSGKPVVYRYNSAEFANFTGRGYIFFGGDQTDVKLEIKVPKTRKYLVLVKHYLKKQDKTTMVVYLTAKDKERSYAAVIDLYPTAENVKTGPSYALVKTADGEKEFVFTKGLWEMDMSSISTELLIDHVVIIPEEYYTANKLQPDAVLPCLAGQAKGTICKMYKYISMQKFQMIQAESGTNSKGFGFDVVRKTNLFKDPDLLLQLPVLNDMAELSRKQIALTLEVTATTTSNYHLVVTYFNPHPRTYRLQMYDGESGKRGYIEAIPCLYQFLCRVVVLHTNGYPLSLRYEVNQTSEITFIGNIRDSLAIDYISLLPTEEWSPDYLLPHKLCYMKNNVCLQNEKFQTPQDSVPITPTSSNPANPLTNSVYAVSEKSVFFTASLLKQATYILVYQYYQPNLPSFHVKIKIIQGTVKGYGLVKVQHCSANSGCRGVYKNGALQGDVTVVFEIPLGKELWIDSTFLVPEATYQEDVLLPKRTEFPTKFKRSCLDKNSLPLMKAPEGFCMQALVALTSEFTNKTYRCNCNQRGSLSLDCAKIGGQCSCRKGVVGKNCDKCQTGYYGFPYCKACNCFIGGSISAECDRYGHCKCKPKYHGRKCNRCVKNHWGFPDCRECSCDWRGSFSSACRDHDGQCSCSRNYGGRQCNKCRVGFFDYPSCRSCNCNAAGIITTAATPTGCYKNDPNRCDCKTNVEGSYCERCKENFYGLDVRNPFGCKKCNCSSFGTVRGAGTCHKQTGQCVCQANAAGINCDSCQNGFYVVKTDKIFSCQPCLCSAGGSLHNVCDKITGQCKCKARVSGLKCDRVTPGDYYLPSIAHVFGSKDITPSATLEYLDSFDGAKVNGSFASMRQTLVIQPSGYVSDVDSVSTDGFYSNVKLVHKRSYYVLIHYALSTKGSRIDLEFTKDGEYILVTHYLKAKKTLKPTVDIVKKNNAYFVLQLPEGKWNLQVVFYETILFNQLTIVPVEHFSKHRISRSINNPCTVPSSTRYCALYTYYDLKKIGAVIIEVESMGESSSEYFDVKKYPAASINGALLLKSDKNLRFTSFVDKNEDFYVIVQYLNMLKDSVELEIEIQNGYLVETGFVELPPCSYAFGCRQTVLLSDGRKAPYKGGRRNRYISLKIIKGIEIFIDFLSLVPTMRWSTNLVTPAFYCLRRGSRCLDTSFPTTNNMLTIEAESAKGVSSFNSSPPDGQASTVAFLVSKHSRHLRWLTPLKIGKYYLIIHYYQTLHEDYLAKIVLSTYNSAVAGKVKFDYCPSMYGCRTVVSYFYDDALQLFFISGNILKATFTMKTTNQVWVDRITFVSPVEYNNNPNILKVGPLDLSKRYLRKCVGRKDVYIEQANKDFCRSSAFELTLGFNKIPQPCRCNQHGTLPSAKCDAYDGQCTCKAGFYGRDCSKCEDGYFPYCKPRKNLYR